MVEWETVSEFSDWRLTRMMWANVAIWRRIEGIMIAPRGANSNALELSIVAIHIEELFHPIDRVTTAIAANAAGTIHPRTCANQARVDNQFEFQTVCKCKFTIINDNQAVVAIAPNNKYAPWASHSLLL